MDKVPVLEAEGLAYYYEKEKKVLKDVNASFYAGEKIAVLGANGAGKSTFFLCLNGVLKPKFGRILINGKPGDKKGMELRRHTGIVFQDADSQIIASSVEEEVSFGPMNLKLPKAEIERRTKSALAYMNLEELADRPPHYLSGGEKKRVTIADILAMEPEVLLFDEPSASLDPLNRDALEQVMEKLHREGKTLIISTHDVDFAYRFADRVIVFADGCITADGAPQEVFGNKEVLDRAHIKVPVLYELYKKLVEKKTIVNSEEKPYPVTAAQLVDLL